MCSLHEAAAECRTALSDGTPGRGFRFPLHPGYQLPASGVETWLV